MPSPGRSTSRRSRPIPNAEADSTYTGSMPRTLTKTRGTVLRSWNLGEADRILEIQTDELGLVRAVARGVRRVRSKLAGHLEPLTDVELMLASGRGDLMTVTGAKARALHSGLRTNLDQLTAASAVAELVSRSAPAAEPNPQLSELTRTALAALEITDQPEWVSAFYEWQLVRAGGWEPELGQCVSCGRSLEPARTAFSFTAGGTICHECRLEDPAAVEIGPEAVKVLRLFSQRSYRELTQVEIPAAVRQEVIELVDRLVQHTLDREPKAKRVGKQLTNLT